MESNERILVIILSAALAVFLIVGIVATIKIIQILNTLKRITVKAEQIADKAEAVGEFFQRTAGPVAIGRLLSNMAESVFKHKDKKRKDSDG